MEFERDGFIVFEDFFDTGLMNDLDARVRKHFGDAPTFVHDDEFLDKAQTDVIPWFPQNEGVAAFDAIDNDERLNELTRGILGDGWASQYLSLIHISEPTRLC